MPLSITTAPRGPYDDSFGPGGLLRYRYRGKDPDHPDNRGLRLALRRQLPLVYPFGVLPGRYVASWPAYIVGDEPGSLTFSVAVDEAKYLRLASTVEEQPPVSPDETLRRAYVTATTRVRLHQRAFRERVLQAYRGQCAFCRLRHQELLDAAHIIPDPEPEGEPRISNGLALCALHHAAFDRFFVGLRPDYVIEVRADLLLEEDGPTLVHAIQGLHGMPIALPRQPTHRPDAVLVERRYRRFREARSAVPTP